VGTDGKSVALGSGAGTPPTFTFTGFTNTNNYGSGGNGGGSGAAGSPGTQGVVVIRHPITYAKFGITGGTITTDASYVYYTFTTPGTVSGYLIT
jgi:hypothetical protein